MEWELQVVSMSGEVLCYGSPNQVETKRKAAKALGVHPECVRLLVTPGEILCVARDPCPPAVRLTYGEEANTLASFGPDLEQGLPDQSYPEAPRLFCLSLAECLFSLVSKEGVTDRWRLSAENIGISQAWLYAEVLPDRNICFLMVNFENGPRLRPGKDGVAAQLHRGPDGSWTIGPVNQDLTLNHAIGCEDLDFLVTDEPTLLLSLVQVWLNFYRTYASAGCEVSVGSLEFVQERGGVLDWPGLWKLCVGREAA